MEDCAEVDGKASENSITVPLRLSQTCAPRLLHRVTITESCGANPEVDANELKMRALLLAWPRKVTDSRYNYPTQARRSTRLATTVAVGKVHHEPNERWARDVFNLTLWRPFYFISSRVNYCLM
ncbi:unnamed protein product [Linum tenue]|uniref:Uncharacterized protein n=1 Tax=Linum tenue TaxID=586396 RepID=A0AAV0S3L8_9ROSI|nr:unnamed protein product [Linum tenue]